MVVPYSFSLLANLPFFVAEAFLLTDCIWHTSRWFIWPKSYILLSKIQKILFCSLSCLDQRELLVHDTSILPIQQFCRILPTTLDVASHLPVLTFKSFPQLLIFLHHQWYDQTLLCCCIKHFRFPKEINSSPNFLFTTDLIISFSTIFIPSKSSGTLQGINQHCEGPLNSPFPIQIS